MGREKISCMQDFVDSFLAYYAIKTSDEHGYIYLSNDYKDLLMEIMNKGVSKDFSDKLDFRNDGNFDIDSFSKKLKTSKILVKKEDPIEADEEFDCIKMEINREIARNEVDNRDIYQIVSIYHSVELFIKHQYLYETEKKEKNERKTVLKLVDESDD